VFSTLKNILDGFAIHCFHAWYSHQATMVTCSKPQEAAAVRVPAYLWDIGVKKVETNASPVCTEVLFKSLSVITVLC
jgi:hypothetical protein